MNLRGVSRTLSALGIAGVTFAVTALPLSAQSAVSAVNDAATVSEDASVTINVLANDTGTGLTLQSVTDPPHGTAAISGGQVVYTPDQNFHGTDTFAYTVTDGTTSVGAAVTVTVRNGGAATATATSVTVSSTATGVDFPDGASADIATLAPYEETTLTFPVHLADGTAPGTVVAFEVAADNSDSCVTTTTTVTSTLAEVDPRALPAAFHPVLIEGGRLPAMLAGEPLQVAHIPGLDDEGRRVLVDRLVREGVLAILDRT